MFNQINDKDINWLMKNTLIKIRSNNTNLIISKYKEIIGLSMKSENLKQTRDILLPRLISGEINVENMEVI